MGIEMTFSTWVYVVRSLCDQDYVKYNSSGDSNLELYSNYDEDTQVDSTLELG